LWKIVRILAAMVVSGVVTLFVTMLILMELGSKFHGNYEYYGQYPVLVWGPAVIGFLAPGVLVWYMDQRGYERARKIVGTLALMVVSGIVPLFVAGFMLLEFEGKIHGNLKGALWLGAYGLAIIGFLSSGVIVWYLHKRGTRKGQSG
jgi:hypothetical protein